MAKRFTDTEKWKKLWFRELSPEHKCFWQYLTDNCTHAGVWEVDFGLASYLIGISLDEKEIREQFKKQYVEIDDGKRWFIKDFVGFQYGELNEKVIAHKSVMSSLKKLSVPEGLWKGSATELDKDMDMDKDKDKDMGDVVSFQPIDLELSQLLAERITTNTPTFKQPNFDSWATHIRLMRERDNRTPDQIRYVIDWCQKDTFWQANILSTKKLREKFDTLVAQMKRKVNEVELKKSNVAFA